MIMNLVINASNAQPKGGRVGVFRSTHRTNGTLVDLTVADDGPGIPPGSATKYSGRSTRRDPTARDWAWRSLCAPRATRRTHRLRGPRTWFHRRGVRRFAPGASRMSPRVLVVDDERSIRDSLSRQLTPLGYECAAAEGAEQAMGAMHEFDPAVVITDVRMSGASGLELLSWIRERVPEVDVIVMTAHQDMNTALAAMKAGAYDYLIKPLDLDQIELVLSLMFPRSHAAPTRAPPGE